MPERKCLAGSGSTMLQCMNHLHSLGLFTEEELWQVAYHNPLQAIGMEAAGSKRMVEFSKQGGFSPAT
jgi:N-acetylglucosamine-6-phosphate deacetylase